MARKRILILCLILNLLFIWGNSLLRREVSARLSDRVMDVMNAAAEKLGLGPDFFTFHTDEDGDGEPDRTSLLVRKLAHITEFACLGALLRLLTDEREGAAALSALYAAGTAASDEALQLLSHRGAQLRDVLLDCAGAALGIFLVAAVRRARRGSASERGENPPV